MEDVAMFKDVLLNMVQLICVNGFLVCLAFVAAMASCIVLHLQPVKL